MQLNKQIYDLIRDMEPIYDHEFLERLFEARFDEPTDAKYNPGSFRTIELL